MQRKKAFVYCALLLLLCATSCETIPTPILGTDTESETMVIETIPEERKWYNFFNQTENGDVKAATNQYDNVPLTQLTPYELTGFREYLPFRGVVSLASSNIYYLNRLKSQYPIERISVLDEETICVTYKVVVEEKQGYLCILAYHNGDGNTWILKDEHYYVSKTLSFSDFSHISVGDPLGKVYDTDPATWFDVECDPIYIFRGEDGYRKTNRLLADGVLSITYRFTDSQGEWIQEPRERIISAIEFVPYGNSDANFDIIEYPNTIELP